MAQFKKHENYRFWHSPIALGILLLLVIAFMYNVFGLIEKTRETSKKKELMLEQIDNLHKRESSLTTDISKLETEQGIEDTIRDKYQVAKEGEKMVVIVDEERKESEIIDSTINHDFWSWIKKIFKK